MINIPYLLKILDTEDLGVLVDNIDLVPLDMNLAISDSEAAGEIEVDREKKKVKLLVEPTPSSNPDLENKIIRTAQHYAKRKINITRGRLNQLIKDPSGQVQGYGWHEYIPTLQHIIDKGLLVEETIEVPKSKKRPGRIFVFLGFPENAEVNQEWNAREVNNWIAKFEKAK